MRRLALFFAVLFAAPFVALLFGLMGFCVGGFGLMRTAFDVLWGHDAKEG